MFETRRQERALVATCINLGLLIAAGLTFAYASGLICVLAGLGAVVAGFCTIIYLDDFVSDGGRPR